MVARLRNCFADPSGGLLYHWRAWRYRQRLWQPFLLQIERWLAAWQPVERELVIVGASAGYTLPEAFLRRFERCTILEPDPLARWLLRRRFPGITFDYGTLDCMADTQGPQALAEVYPEAAFLFSNVLGQRMADLPEGWLANFLSAMQQRCWASYHDVVATEQAPIHWDARGFPANAHLEEVLAGFWAGGELALYDHQSFGRLPAQAYVPWVLRPGHYHLVGWNS